MKAEIRIGRLCQNTLRIKKSTKEIRTILLEGFSV